MRYCFIFIAFVSLLCSCKGTQPVDDADVLVKVKDRTLRRSEIKQQIPRGLSSADSMLLAESLERKWVKDALVYDVALRNLEGEDKAEVDKLVEEYRHSLIRYRYQEQLIKERLSSEFQESDMLSYYEENQKKFVLDKALVKGLFLKIPVDAPGLGHQLRAGAHGQVVGVREHHLAAELAQLVGGDPLHRGGGAHGHEHGRVEVAVGSGVGERAGVPAGSVACAIE